MARERTTRELVLSSWHAARRKADRDGAVTLTAAGFAGYALEQAGGDARAAQEAVPAEMERFWERATEALEQIEAEEQADTERPIMVGTTGLGR